MKFAHFSVSEIQYIWNANSSHGSLLFSWSYNLGQMEGFTTNFFAIVFEKHQNLAFGWPATYSPLNSSIQGFSWNFLISYNPKS